LAIEDLPSDIRGVAYLVSVGRTVKDSSLAKLDRWILEYEYRDAPTEVIETLRAVLSGESVPEEAIVLHNDWVVEHNAKVIAQATAAAEARAEAIATQEAIVAQGLVGLAKSVEDSRIVYRAEVGNPYGLEQGAFAGYYYPEAYILDTEANFERESQIGAVSLRSEVVRVLLYQAGYPDKIVFPIPCDISDANNLEEKIIIWEASPKRAPDRGSIFAHLPKGSIVVADLPNEQGYARIRIRPHSWGRVFLTFEPGGAFSGEYKGYTLSFGFSNTRFKEWEEITLSFGDALSGSYLKRAFSDDYIKFLEENYTIPDVLKKSGQELNVLIGSNTLVDPIQFAVVTKDNLLRVGDSLVFILANDNPILGKTFN